jgi:hypothetical protein
MFIPSIILEPAFSAFDAVYCFLLHRLARCYAQPVEWMEPSLTKVRISSKRQPCGLIERIEYMLPGSLQVKVLLVAASDSWDAKDCIRSVGYKMLHGYRIFSETQPCGLIERFDYRLPGSLKNMVIFRPVAESWRTRVMLCRKAIHLFELYSKFEACSLRMRLERIIQVQRSWRRKQNLIWRLHLAMALHPRLGGQSQLGMIGDVLSAMIVPMLH